MKAARHAKILEIIATHPVHTQEELAALLHQKGFRVTQATVSRDIKELKLIKVHGEGEALVYASANGGSGEPHPINVEALFGDAVLHAEHAGHIVVIKTRVGMAQGIASLLDQMNLPATLGTIAGDDTIMVVARTAEDAEQLAARLRKLIK